VGENIEIKTMQHDGSSPTHVIPLSKGIAICSVGELFGGVERHILGLLSGLQANSIKALLVLFHDGELAAQARNQGFELIILPSQNWTLWKTSQTLAGILRQRKIRVVHVHGYKATVFCAMVRRWYRFAMVKTEHGLPEPMTGRPLRTLLDRFYHFLDTAATRMSDATVCYVTEDLRAHHMHTHTGLQVTVIPNGVPNMNREQFKRPLELRADWFNLAIVGRIDTVKGHHVAIEALATPDTSPSTHLQIVGVGPKECELRSLAKMRGIADRVHFLGFRRNVYDYLAHCDILLMPSLHEGLPYTLLEAMSLGKPIIASRIGGLAEVVEHRTTGLLIPVADPSILGNAIRELCDDLELRKQIAEGARRLQQSRYSLDAMAIRYFEVYHASVQRATALDKEY